MDEHGNPGNCARCNAFDDDRNSDDVCASCVSDEHESEWLAASQHPSYWSGGYNTDYGGAFPVD
jgi:hypothetical protein